MKNCLPNKNRGKDISGRGWRGYMKSGNTQWVWRVDILRLIVKLSGGHRKDLMGVGEKRVVGIWGMNICKDEIMWTMSYDGCSRFSAVEWHDQIYFYMKILQCLGVGEQHCGWTTLWSCFLEDHLGDYNCLHIFILWKRRQKTWFPNWRIDR